jgi:hypothetical protein
VTDPEYGCGPFRRFSSGLLSLRLALRFFLPLLALRFFWFSGLPLERTLLSSLDYLFLFHMDGFITFFRLYSHVWIMCVLWSQSLFCLVGLAPFSLETIVGLKACMAYHQRQLIFIGVGLFCCDF